MKFPPRAAAFYFKESPKTVSEILSDSEFSDYFEKTLEKLSRNSKGFPVYTNLWRGPEAESQVIAKKLGYSEFIILSSDSEADFVSQVAERLPASESGDPDWDETSFFLFDGLAPLSDPKLISELATRHDKYLAQYSYSENLPPGIVPRILSREFVRSLPPGYAGGTQEFLAKNINHYDTEIFYSSPDLRQWRLDFSLKDTRSKMLVSSFLSRKSDWKYEEIQPFLSENPEVFRSAPGYYEIEVFRGCESECVFCPRQSLDPSQDGIALEPAILDSILNQAEEFGSDYSLCFGGLGEPTLHPKLDELIRRALQSTHLKELFIESALYASPEKLIQGILSVGEEERKKISLIVNLTTRDKQTYTRLYGKDNLEKVLRHLEEVSRVLPKSSVYLQFLKIKDVDPELDSWYEETQKAGYEVILQKYNSYADKLAQRRASDLTPLGRDFCWHLSRDLYVNADGSVSVCKQIPASFSPALGNLKTDSLKEIWKKGNPHFAASVRGQHDRIPAPCLNCDEWYTFNA